MIPGMTTRITIDAEIDPAGKYCNKCRFLDFSLINGMDRAWCCNAYSLRLTIRVPISDPKLIKREKKRYDDSKGIRRCDECLAFDKPELQATVAVADLPNVPCLADMSIAQIAALIPGANVLSETTMSVPNTPEASAALARLPVLVRQATDESKEPTP